MSSSTGLPEEIRNVLETICLHKQLATYKVFGDGSSTTLVLRLVNSSNANISDTTVDKGPATSSDVNRTTPLRKKSPSQLKRDQRRAEERKQRQQQQRQQQQQQQLQQRPQQQKREQTYSERQEQQANTRRNQQQQQQQKQKQHEEKEGGIVHFQVDKTDNDCSLFSVNRPIDSTPSISSCSEFVSNVSDVSARAACDILGTVNNRPSSVCGVSMSESSSTFYSDTDLTGYFDDSMNGTGTMCSESLAASSATDSDLDYDEDTLEPDVVLTHVDKEFVNKELRMIGEPDVRTVLSTDSGDVRYVVKREFSWVKSITYPFLDML